MMLLRSKILLVLLAVVLMIGGAASYEFYRRSHTPTASATVFPEPRVLEAFTLIDTQGRPFTLQQLKQHWSLMFFGFTRCPSICPTTLSTLNQLYQQLAERRQQPIPQVIFISIDPAQDTLSRIKHYATGFNPAFIGLTGTSSQLASLTKALGVMYMTVKGDDGTNTIDHTGSLFLFNPQGQLTAIFSMPHDAKELADNIRIITG